MPHMTIYIPFGDDEAEVVGDFTPEDPGCRYLSNGDPGWPPTLAEFYIEKFIVNGNDILQELMQMYKKSDNTKFVWYIDYITPLLIEKAEEEYNEQIQQDMLDRCTDREYYE